LGAASNRTDRPVVCGVRGVGVSISLADTPEIASSVLAIVGGIGAVPLLAIHSTIDTLGLVIITKNVDHDLVADIWVSGLGRVTGVVSGLRGTSRGACCYTLVERLDLREAEEFVAHIHIRIGDWVVGGVYGTAEFDGAREAGLVTWLSVLIVSIAATNHYMKAICGGN
jgi:hypothetical protein